MRSSLPARFTRKPLAKALFGGTVAIGIAALPPAFAEQAAWPANPAATARPLMLASSCNPSRRSCGQMLSTRANSFDSASTAGSVATTSKPRDKKYAAQPAPIVPVPTQATRQTASGPRRWSTGGSAAKPEPYHPA